jgi:putative nucleotidyltransferase with HDIG domain
MGVFMMFTRKTDRNLRQFWAHCYEVASTAGLIAQATTMVNGSTAYLAGLLHDIGRLIFFSLNFQQYRAILGTDDLLERETEIFGCDHALAGSWFAEKAKLPEEITLSIRHHHAPSAAKSYHDIVSVVAISEALSRRFSPKIEDDGIWTSEHDAILLELSLSSEDLDDIEEKLGAEKAEIDRFLDLQ